MSRLAPLEPQALAYDKPLCASLDGFTLHAATRAGALDPAGREALLRYVLRPAVAQERVEQRPDGLVRITFKKAYTDGTIAVDMDPLSLLCRLATSVPSPRLHTLRYAGVLAPASPWRSRLTSRPPKPSPRATRRVGRITRGDIARWAELWRARSSTQSTASRADEVTGRVRITHPFHPQFGQDIDFVERRHRFGEERVLYRDRHGHLVSLPARWTSVGAEDPFVVVAGGRSRFRVADLLELVELIGRLRS